MSPFKTGFGSAKMPVYLLIMLAIVIASIVSLSNGYTHFVIALVAIATIVGVGLNILYGLTGLISFGHIAFYAIGAYSCALLLLQGVNYFLALFCSAVLTGVIGLVFAVPAVRVKGAFLAMVTIAFAFVVEHTLVEWRSLTGGQNGLSGFPFVTLGSLVFAERELAILASCCACLALLSYFFLERSGWGMAMKSVRDSEIASASLGYDTARVKTIAFGISALFAGAAGAIYTPLIMFIAPSNFPFSQSILFLFSVILGGVATTLGPLFGAVVTVMLPEILSDLAQYRLLFFGALLLAVLLLAPAGIVGQLARWVPATHRPDDTLHDKTNSEIAIQWLATVISRQSLKTERLSIAFGGVKAVKNVGFTANPKQVLSIIGPNGAGKTTVLNIISGFYQPDAGTVMIDDKDIAFKPAHLASQAGIARTYQTTRLYDKMSVQDNVMAGLQHGKIGSPFSNLDSVEQRSIAIGLLRLCGYRGSCDTQASNLPHVDRRFVEFARALATAPSVMLLDEPAAGLMRSDKDALRTTIRKIASLGVAVVLVEHDMTLVMEISDKILVLDSGEPIAYGVPDTIRQDKRVIAAYLGNEGFEAPARTSLLQPSTVPLLSVQQLIAGYGAASVLREVNVDVYPGELVAILGANGAGKSTLMSALMGLLNPESGSVVLDGTPIQDLTTHQIVAQGLVLVPEGRQVFPELTVTQNILLGAYKRQDIDNREEIEHLLQRFPRLRERISSQAGFLSGGEQQMLAIARGLMARPRVLLLDEPSLGLSPGMISELYLALANLRDEGVTILLVDQMANMALDIADRAYVLEQGMIVAEGASDHIRSNGALADAYLGSSKDKRDLSTVN